MKAAQFTRFAAPLEIVAIPTPAPPPGGVVIEVKAAGVCRSDWHAWQGLDPDIKSLPHVPGHEFSGTISALGEGVTKWRIGDRVTAPFACGCGSCRQCNGGNTQVCPNQYQPGVTGPGAFAEFVVIPGAATNLVQLPEAVSFAAAASLGCRFATAYRALAHLDQAALQPGERVAVFGCGGVGLSAVMIAAALGAEVTAIDIRDPALESAMRLGAVAARHFDEIGDLRADVTVDALGKTETCLAALNSLEPRGRHVQIGLMLGEDAKPRIPMGTIIAKELKIIGSHGMGAAAYPELLGRIANGTLTPEKLIANSISLEQLPEALHQLGSFQTDPGLTVIDRFATA
jgi:alcohol dehydrogenase